MSELDEIQGIFFEECVEGLVAAEAGLSRMAGGDVSAPVIAGVFRAVHSIKGGAGAFGHVALTTFAHGFENVLDEVRSERIEATPQVVGVMLTAFDMLSDHVAAAKGAADTPDDGAVLAALEQVLVRTTHVDDFGFEPLAIAFEDIVFENSTFGTPWTVRFGPSRAALANASEPLLVVRELESLGGEVVGVDASRLPPLRDLDPEDGYLVWTISVPGTVEESAIADCFDFVAPDSLVEIVRDEAVDATAANDVTPATHNVIPAKAGTQDSGVDRTVAHFRSPISEAGTLGPGLRRDYGPQRSEVANSGTPPTPGPAQAIRVDLIKLDRLLNLVGELVIRGSILCDRLSPKEQERAELPDLARLTREIQGSVMSLRAQPIRQAFGRVPRMLRDLATETGKQVVLQTIGEATEVDKGVIEGIGDPLTHMIRNAVDHGIESPAARIAAGKPAAGTITVSAEQKGARLFVRVADDGRGIDRARVLAKAVEGGIVPASATLSDEEIDQLICAPGFSTSDTVSSISGRGVGMDVVRSNVEALGGRVEIGSVPGVGTTFTMILPLTLAILDGMVVRIGGQRYVLPLANVIETVQPAPGQVRSMTPTSEIIEVRGRYLPVRRPAEIFGFADTDKRADADLLVIVVESESAGAVGLVVDTIDDRREVVIKSIEQNLYPVRGVGGATILGDGSIALILDVEALVGARSATAWACPERIAA